ncbi:ABC transporter substrate-binding protein [Holophaga foetida]|uniref:ABC transporter substrate-binding protein n=1 Tax=Holophaga foetida TaxID=35839 RepID=UPI00024732E6|nr:ABC transporter substrate-binding protein [Holophaga foetida]
MKRLIFLFALVPALLWGRVPLRVVSHTVGTDDLLLAVADPGQIAALSRFSRDPRYSIHARENEKHPTVRDAEAESILRHKPDLVLITSYSKPEVVELLRRSKVNLMLFDHFESLEDAYANLRRLGQTLGHPERAEAVIQRSQARVAELQKRLAGVKPVRVMAAGIYPFVAGAGTTFDDLCLHAGAINVVAQAGVKGHQPMPTEKVLTWNPDVLVGAKDEDLPTILPKTPPYKYLPAMKYGRLVLIPRALFSNTTHLRIEGYEWLARALHPERFR